jgi:hypothetical protein
MEPTSHGDGSRGCHKGDLMKETDIPSGSESALSLSINEVDNLDAKAVTPGKNGARLR